MDETGQIVSYIDVENSQDPYIGKEFQSREDSFKFYLDYAHRSDFSIRRDRMIRSRKDKLIIGQEFVCSKQGLQSKKKLESINYNMKLEKDAKYCYIYQRKKKVNGLFVGLSLSTIMSLHLQTVKNSCEQRKKSETQKTLIDLLDNSGVRPSKIASILITQAGGVDQLNLIGQDIQNYLRTRRQKDLKK
ncbi:putative E3 ubiquitin-protein ligase-like [Capsicum annuum]|nr:putative E3 ubiquitin-protein ligase-like [Capsicum annuum]